MTSVHSGAIRCESPDETWRLAELRAQPFPEEALHDALAYLEWHGNLSPENLQTAHEFAARHDLWEQEPEAMTERLRLVRAEVATDRAKSSAIADSPEHPDRLRFAKEALEARWRAMTQEELAAQNLALVARMRARYGAEGWTVAEVKQMRAPFDRGDHVEMGDRLLVMLRRLTETTFTEGEFYRYAPNAGVFETIGNAELSRNVQLFAGASVAVGGKDKYGHPKVKPLKLKSADVKGTLALAADQADDPDFFANARSGIAFAGSFVEVTPSGIVMHEPSSEHRARVAYDFEYEPTGEPVQFLTALREMFRDDSDCEEKIACLQEHIGMSLIGRGTKFQKVVLLAGEGSNGKSTAMSILERCFPAESVIAVPPQSLDEDYKRAKLVGAKLNLVGELPENEIVASESWKAVVDGLTKIGARSPYKEAFFFLPTAGHIYAANRLPGTADHSRGFWRRWIVIFFNRKFEDWEQDAGLADRIIETERGAIVSWLLRGARRALANGRYTIPASSEAAVTKWQGVSNQVAAFIESEYDHLKQGADERDWAKADGVYQNYRAWALRSGHTPMSLTKFGERMQGLGLGSKRQGRGCTYPVQIKPDPPVSKPTPNEHYEHFLEN